jgi:hypothetical protein
MVSTLGPASLPAPSDCTCDTPNVGINFLPMPPFHFVGHLQSVIDAINPTCWSEPEPSLLEEEYTQEELSGVQQMLQASIMRLTKELKELEALQDRVRYLWDLKEGYMAWEERLDRAQDELLEFLIESVPGWVLPRTGEHRDGGISLAKGPGVNSREKSGLEHLGQAWVKAKQRQHRDLGFSLPSGPAVNSIESGDMAKTGHHDSTSSSSSGSMDSGFEDERTLVDGEEWSTCDRGAPSAPSPSVHSTDSHLYSPGPVSRWRVDLE